MHIAGALACCNGDTWASELGAVMSSGEPILITSLQPVPRGVYSGSRLAFYLLCWEPV